MRGSCWERNRSKSHSPSLSVPDGAGVSTATKKLDRTLDRNSTHVKDKFGFSAC